MLPPTIAVLAWLVAPRPPARSAPLLMSGAAGTAAGGGGDLSGGNDEERNAQLASLRNMMFAAPEEAEVPGASEVDSAERVGGLLLDLPLVRYSWCILPHHQIAMSVWQPQYTLLFDKLLAQPPPHYYLHVLLPGGAESLGQPGYELEPGTKSSLVGTLTRVVFARRNVTPRLSLTLNFTLTRTLTCTLTLARPTRRSPLSCRGCAAASCSDPRSTYLTPRATCRCCPMPRRSMRRRAPRRGSHAAARRARRRRSPRRRRSGGWWRRPRRWRQAAGLGTRRCSSPWTTKARQRGHSASVKVPPLAMLEGGSCASSGRG